MQFGIFTVGDVTTDPTTGRTPSEHERIRATVEREAAKNNVRFLYRDFRPRFRTGQQAAREMDLYMQKYCGCIFSEEERYQKKQRLS